MIELLLAWALTSGPGVVGGLRSACLREVLNASTTPSAITTSGVGPQILHENETCSCCRDMYAKYSLTNCGRVKNLIPLEMPCSSYACCVVVQNAVNGVGDAQS